MTDHCHKKLRPGCVSLASLDVDPIDFAFLTASRFFFVSFSEADARSWVSTILSSGSFFPGPGSAERMRRALAVIDEMRSARRSCFQYSNPRCPCCAGIVTADERHLLQMVQHARAGRMSRVMSSAMLLCEGNPTDRVIVAVDCLVRSLAQPGATLERA